MPRPIGPEDRVFTEAEANEVFDILVAECKAPESQRDQFVYHQTKEVVREWRFGGLLGFGGKFWRNDDRCYVNYYPEDERPEMVEAKERADKRLAAFVAKNFGDLSTTA